jgi:acetolactate synthase-1/2/3 large subunit
MTDGVDALCEALRAVGIEQVFGVPGTQNVQLFDGFRRHGLRTVLSTHELAAAFMATGYFRATGRIAALATIPGPGFTYALTGLAEARLDSAGILYLVGKPASSPGQHFQLQAIDQRAIAAPLVKGCFSAYTPIGVQRVVRDAYALAASGEPGPVMVEMDLEALANGPALPDASTSSSTTPRDDGGARKLEQLFGRADRPVFMLGQGAFDAAERIGRVAELLTIPVVTTPSARGIVPEDHEMVLGFDPLRGNTARLNELLDQSDLVIALGCKLGHNGSAGFQLRLPTERFIQVDADASVVGATYPSMLGITARVEDVVARLESRGAATLWTKAEVSAARTALRALPADALEPRMHGARTMTPREFFAWLRDVLPPDAIVVTDSGLHQILTRRYFDVLSPRGLIVPSDFQSMGFGLPAAIGAKLGAPERMVVAVVGDGGFLMSGLELLTARRERVPIVVFVFNDGHLNQIRMQQMTASGHPHAVDLLNPDYRALADALGLEYVRLGEGDGDRISRNLKGNSVLLVEVIVGDSVMMRVLPGVNRAKGVVRAAMRPGLRDWLKARLHRRPPTQRP